MQILTVDAYTLDDPDRRNADAAIETLGAKGHAVRRVDVVANGFTPFMSTEERMAYHDEGENVLADEVEQSVGALREADALLFCYPTTTFAVPAALKGWMERVLLPGVAFGFDTRGRVKPGMTNIRRLGVVTSTPHGRVATARAKDGGRRVIMWTLRLNCAKSCRRTFVSVAAGRDQTDAIRRRLGRW